MSYGYPLPAHSDLPETAAGSRPRAATRAGAELGSWRYPDCSRSRAVVITAMALSAAVHLGVLFGFTKAKIAPKRVEAVPTIALTLPPPQLKEL